VGASLPQWALPASEHTRLFARWDIARVNLLRVVAGVAWYAIFRSGKIARQHGNGVADSRPSGSGNFDVQLWRKRLAKAVNYTRGQWEQLNVFCTDGAVPIDDNMSEREMKRVVLNRKNSLFVGNPRSGQTAAILANLTSANQRHEIDPQLYLTQLLVNLLSWLARDLNAWLPDQWKLRQATLLTTLQDTAIADS
jgi:hypothetical protein